MNWAGVSVVIGLLAVGWAARPWGMLLVLAGLAWLCWKS